MTLPRALLLLAAVAVVAASCSSAEDSVAASVDSADILISDVLALRESYGGDAIVAADFRDDLSRLIFQEVVAQGLDEEFGLVVADVDVQARVDEFNQAVADTGVTRAEALGIPGATEELLYREALAFEMRSQGVIAVVASPSAIADLQQSPELITEVCVRHILVDSRAAAEDVAERLGSGEDFAAVAGEVSLDSTPDGDLGCSPASRYVPEFADASVVAPIGSAFGPVETQFGFHILVVDSRTAPTAEELAADPLSFVPDDVAGNLWVNWFNGRVETADITVASEIGSWNATASAISPPG